MWRYVVRRRFRGICYLHLHDRRLSSVEKTVPISVMGLKNKKNVWSLKGPFWKCVYTVEMMLRVNSWEVKGNQSNGDYTASLPQKTEVFHFINELFYTMSLFPSQCNTIYIIFFLSSSFTTCFGLTWPSSGVDHYAKLSHCINNYFGYTVLFCFSSDTLGLFI
jgi:hypothetical protein